jgi:hypothetical protein
LANAPNVEQYAPREKFRRRKVVAMAVISKLMAIRTKAAALATASNWIFTFLVVEITPVSINSIGWHTYIYFAIFNAAFLPLIWFFYPEVRNLSLEQVDKMFTGEKVMLDIAMTLSLTRPYPDPTLYTVGSGRLKYL